MSTDNIRITINDMKYRAKVWREFANKHDLTNVLDKDRGEIHQAWRAGYRRGKEYATD